jgi:ATP-binding cassette subfamily B multidrug efflux pump
MGPPSAGSSPWRRLLPYFTRHKRALGFGVGSIVLTTTIQLLGPWVLKYAVDDLQHGVTRGKLGYYAALLFAVSAGGGVFRFLMRRSIIGVSREIEYDLRNDFFAHLQRMPPEYFRARRTGDLMSRATNDLNAVRMMAGPSIMYASQTTLVFVVGMALMLSIDARLTLIALIPLPMVSVFVKLFGSAIHRRFEKIQEQLSELSAVAQENLSGVRVVRAYGQEASELERFKRANDEYIARNRGLIRLQGAFYPSLTLLLGFGALLVLWQGSRDVIQGRITVGELVAFNAYLVMLSWPMIAFGWVTNMMQRGMASWKRMLEILDAPPAIADPPPSRLRRFGETSPSDSPVDDASEVRGHVEFRGLNYSYGDRLVLEGIDLRIEPGTTVAVVGPTGSGKTTLLQTLTRLLDPPPGTVFVDGVDVRDLPLKTLRRLVGVAPQEPFLFSDSLESNIAFAPEIAALSEGPRRAAVQRAASDSRLDKDVADFPNGFQTMVGERGITLSGGQKQRTALARALATDPRILVLDDALSAVDTHTEEEILERLRGVRVGRTCLIVAHRVSTVRDADLIVVMDDGKIVERGTHDELVALGGAYAALHQAQLLEEELEEDEVHGSVGP